jgi:hypothetical protein
MYRWRYILMLALACGGWNSAACADDEVAPQATVNEPATNDPFQRALADEPSFFGSDDEPFDKPLTKQEYLRAAPPPEPSQPQWGDLERPLREPVRLPTLNYLQAGPPRLIVPREWTQPYRRDIADPDQVLLDDTRYNMPIDLYRPDGFAPAGVVGDHTLKTGQALASYRFFENGFQGNLVGTHNISTAAINRQFPLAPKSMRRQQHTFLFEFAPTDDLTILAYLPIYHITTDYLQQSGGMIHDSNTQLGDIPVYFLYALKRWKHQQLHLNMGLQFPVGLIDTQSDFPTPTSVNLSYPMRTGTGSFEVLPGLTYRGQTEHWTWGAQSIASVPLGRNRYGYEVGNQIDITAWLWRRWTQRLATSIRFDGRAWGNVRGADARLNPMLSPTTNPGLQGGTRTDLLFGINYYLPDGRFPGQRFSVESGFPIYQNLHGPQLKARWILNLGYNFLW